ncbi:hypothetical protein nACB1_090 [Acinetobacter phage nACB1]|nr:hypothetical protein nACB1_090 [Acinetobacter phage nACB1]
MEEQVTKAPMELAMEYIAANPSLTEVLDDAAFQAFWEYPEECIEQHQKVINMMKVRFQFTDEMVEEHCKEFLCDACKFISDLKAKEALNP